MSELFETVSIILGLGVFYLFVTWAIIMFMMGRK
jgi:hypothetical protein